MNTKEAIQAMLDRKKVRIQEWDETEYVYIADDGHIRDEKERIFAFTSANTYKIYEEPKPKETVTIEKWLCKHNIDGEYRIFETSKISALLTIGWAKVKLLETYEL